MGVLNNESYCFTVTLHFHVAKSDWTLISVRPAVPNGWLWLLRAMGSFQMSPGVVGDART